MSDLQKQLSIALTEPIVFLRSSDPSGRLQPDPSDAPALVRGILTLNVTKPIDISFIEVELSGVMTVSYPERVVPYYADVPEKHKIYSSIVTVFRADQVPHGKRPVSVGPGLSIGGSQNYGERGATVLSRPPSLHLGGSESQSVYSSTSGPSVPLNLGPTPPYTPVVQSPHLIHPRAGAGENPAQTLEELRQALRDSLEGQACWDGRSPFLPCPHSFARSLPNDHMGHTRSHSTTDTSLYNTIKDLPPVLPHHDALSGGPSRSRSPERSHGHGSESRERGNRHESSNTPSSSRLRRSLSSVLDVVMEVTSRTPSRSASTAVLEERERGRKRVRPVAEQMRDIQPRDGIAATEAHTSGHKDRRTQRSLDLGRVFSQERDHEEKDVHHRPKDDGNGWREFKPGAYSYPISFLLPSNLPPTFSIARASLQYTIKAVAHRPSVFKTKLSCRVPLLIVATPAPGAGDGNIAGDPGPLYFQRQWDENLAYSLTLSSRLFLIGSQNQLETATGNGIRTSVESLVETDVEAGATYGTSTLDLTLLPLEKVKIWRLCVFVDQHTKYFDGRKRVLRDEEYMRVKLLEVQDTCPAEEMGLVDEKEPALKNKHRNKHDPIPIPLLPTTISPHRSPLLRYTTEPSILAGPGPYTLSIDLGLPDCIGPPGSGSGLNFTVKQETSLVKVEHSLRIVMRVERVGDQGTCASAGDKKRFFDITVQTPITILSCRCTPEFQTLPRYSPTSEGSLSSRDVCPCQPERHGPGTRPVSSSTRSSLSSEDGVYCHYQTDEQSCVHQQHSRSSSRPRGGDRSPVSPPASSSHPQSYTVHTSSVHGQTTPVLSPHPSRPSSPLARYERLVSGLESEAGEAPPSYESIAPRS